MTSITLSPEQIRSAPPEVRRWIEREIAVSLGLEIHSGDGRRQGAPLAGCSRDELAGILRLIQGALPVVNVFFELGRKGVAFAQDRLEAYRVSDVQHHTQMQSPDQVIACLTLIDEALHRVRGSADASFYGMDGDYCFIAAQTQQNIRQLWFDLIGRGEPAGGARLAPDDGPRERDPLPPLERPAAAMNPAPRPSPT